MQAMNGLAGTTCLIIVRESLENILMMLCYNKNLKGVKKYDCHDIQLYLCDCIAVITQKAASKWYSNYLWCLIL